MGKVKHINNQDWFDPIDKTLPAAIVLDCDGTLSLSNRNIFDFDKSIEDKPLEQIIELAKLYYNNCYKIIVLTARPENARKVTEVWLKTHLNELGNFELLMRKEGDRRPGPIVKEEIYLEKILDKYDVRLVIDDNPEIIRTFQKYNLVTLQVGRKD